MARVLHLLSQRPHLTDSGVTPVGVTGELAPALGEAVTVIPLPRLGRPVEPRAEDLSGFVERLPSALAEAGGAPQLLSTPAGLAELTWSGIFGRVEAVWQELVSGGRTTPGSSSRA